MATRLTRTKEAIRRVQEDLSIRPQIRDKIWVPGKMAPNQLELRFEALLDRAGAVWSHEKRFFGFEPEREPLIGTLGVAPDYLIHPDKNYHELSFEVSSLTGGNRRLKKAQALGALLLYGIVIHQVDESLIVKMEADLAVLRKMLRPDPKIKSCDVPLLHPVLAHQAA